MKRSKDFLRILTGHTSEWWFAFVQGQVSKRFRKNPKDKNHDLMADMEWLGEVSRMAVKTLPTRGKYDANMRAGMVTAYVIAMWYFRLHRAKTMDPNRPLTLRRKSYRSWILNVQAFMRLPVDESKDFTYFKGQKWDNPFGPNAHNGQFR